MTTDICVVCQEDGRAKCKSLNLQVGDPMPVCDECKKKYARQGLGLPSMGPDGYINLTNVAPVHFRIQREFNDYMMGHGPEVMQAVFQHIVDHSVPEVVKAWKDAAAPLR